MEPIVGGASDAFTKIVYRDNYAVVSTRLLSAFFADEEPGDVTASGSARLDYVGRRLEEGRRTLGEDEKEKCGFDVDIKIQRALMVDEESGSGDFGIWKRALLLLCAISSPLWF